MIYLLPIIIHILIQKPPNRSNKCMVIFTTIEAEDKGWDNVKPA